MLSRKIYDCTYTGSLVLQKAAKGQTKIFLDKFLSNSLSFRNMHNSFFMSKKLVVFLAELSDLRAEVSANIGSTLNGQRIIVRSVPTLYLHQIDLNLSINPPIPNNHQKPNFGKMLMFYIYFTYTKNPLYIPSKIAL